MSRFIHRKVYGRGLGGTFRGVYKFFRPLFNFLVPTIKKVAKSKTGKKLIRQAKKSAFKAGVKTLSDITQGENVNTSMTKNLKKATTDILKKVEGVGKISKSKAKSNKKKKNYNFFH